ncbi:MAG: flagellar export protein FliJ [Burkholderiaceae bacterium]|jgi:flagellar FliJ protein|nr:flagellar export protein FliJ [Burkholderiaceae bacterium]
MVDLPTMETLITLAANEVEKAAVRLGHMIRAGTDAEQKLTLLIQYREDYESRFSASRAGGVSVQDYRNFQLFMERLDEAINEQERVVAQAKQDIDLARKAWQECERKRASYDTLASREKLVRFRKELKREQKETDEFANRKARLNKAR